MSCCFCFLVALFEAEVFDIVGNEGDDIVSGECGMFSVKLLHRFLGLVHYLCVYCSLWF